MFGFEGDIGDEDFARGHDQWRAFMERADADSRRVVLLVDGTQSNGLSASQRRYATDFIETNQLLVQRVCAAQAVVLESAIQRGVMTAILWIKPPPTLLKAFATRAEAERFLDEIEGTSAAAAN